MVCVTSDQQIQIDHDEVAEWARKSDAVHDEFNEAIRLLDEAVAEVIAEASKYTESGAPAPIYVNTVEHTKAGIAHLKDQIVKHQKNMKQDSESVLQYSEKVREGAAESAAQVASADTRFTI